MRSGIIRVCIGMMIKHQVSQFHDIVVSFGHYISKDSFFIARVSCSEEKMKN